MLISWLDPWKTLKKGDILDSAGFPSALLFQALLQAQVPHHFWPLFLLLQLPPTEMAPGSKVGQELILLNHRSEHVVQLPTDETSRKHFLPPVHASLSQRDKGKADGLAPERGKYPWAAGAGQGNGDGKDF